MKVRRLWTMWIALGIVVATALIVCVPLFGKGFFVSDDGGWMIIRLSAFYQSFREGQFPVRFLGRLNFGYGYPVANFLYPGFMYIGSLIHILGFPFIETVKLMLGGSLILGSVFTFLWLKKYFSTLGSFIGTLGFVSAPYLLFDMYHRGSVGEVLAVAVAGIGLYAIATQKKWLFGLAVPFLIVSHNSLAFLYLGFYMLYITVTGAWKKLWLIFLVGIGMAAFFWAPAIYERKYVIFDSVAVADPRQYFVTPTNALLLGIPGIVAAITALFIKTKKRPEKMFMFLIFAATIFLVLPIAGFIWRWSFLIHIIQFPYRFLSLVIFLGPWFIAYTVTHANKIIILLLGLVVVGFGAVSVVASQRDIVRLEEPEGYYTTNEATTNVSDEYMPKWVEVKPAKHAPARLEFFSGHGIIMKQTETSQVIDVSVRAAEPSVLQVNMLYYPGWGAAIDSQMVPIEYRNRMGIMRIDVPAGDHHVLLTFRETISRFVADSVSLISGIAFIVLLFL